MFIINLLENLFVLPYIPFIIFLVIFRKRKVAALFSGPFFLISIFIYLNYFLGIMYGSIFTIFLSVLLLISAYIFSKKRKGSVYIFDLVKYGLRNCTYFGLILITIFIIVGVTGRISV